MSAPSHPDNSMEAAAPSAGSSVRRRLVRGFGASAMGPVVTALVQLVSVPVFLRFWGAHLYGEWMVLSAIPIYLSLSDMGFGSVAGNDMTMRVARGDRAGALESFQSTWVLITLASMAVGFAVCAGVWWLPLNSWFHLSLLSGHEIGTVLVLLAIYALVALQGTLILAGFRCDGNYAAGTLGGNLVRMTEWTAATMAVAMEAKPVGVAATYLGVRLCGFVVLSLVMRRKSPWIRYGTEYARASAVRQLAAPAFAFMAFPAGNALSIQGMIIVVGIVLGPIAVTAFSTLRTLTRFAFQVLGAINNAVWPELSVAFGAENLEFARRLHRRACQAALWLCFAAVGFLLVGGPRIYVAWTHGRVRLDLALFHWLLVVVIANSFWLTSSSVAIACNGHQRIALAYLVGTSASIAIAYLLLPRLGLSGAAIALLAVDAVMSWYVLRSSVRILKDSSAGLFKSVLTVPFEFTDRLRANIGF